MSLLQKMYEPFQPFGFAEKKRHKIDTSFKSSVLLWVSDKVADFKLKDWREGGGRSLFPACWVCVQRSKLHLFERYVLKFIAAWGPWSEREKRKRNKEFPKKKSDCFVYSEMTWHKAASLFLAFYSVWQLSCDKKLVWGRTYVHSAALFLTPMSKQALAKHTITAPVSFKSAKWEKNEGMSNGPPHDLKDFLMRQVYYSVKDWPCCLAPKVGWGLAYTTTGHCLDWNWATDGHLD